MMHPLHFGPASAQTLSAFLALPQIPDAWLGSTMGSTIIGIPIPIYIYIPIYIILGFAAYTDQKSYRIPNPCIMVLLAYAVIVYACGWPIHFLSACFFSFFLWLCPIFLSLMFKRTIFFGWGDIKLMGACSLFLPAEHIGAFFALSGFFGILYALFFEKKWIPFAPCIGLAFLLITVW